MPDPHERHGRPNSWGDGYAQPPRSQQRQEAASEPRAKRPPGKKDKNLCKAAHWKGPHTPAFIMQSYGWRAKSVCRWDISWRNEDEPRWYCNHQEVCSECGKILRDSIPARDCPRFYPITDEERAGLAAELTARQERSASSRLRSRWQRKPPITGPQGYRRKH